MWTYGNDSPCRKCTAETGRHAGCHSTCEREMEFINKENEKRERIRKNMIEEGSIKGYFIERDMKNKKRNRKNR